MNSCSCYSRPIYIRARLEFRPRVAVGKELFKFISSSVTSLIEVIALSVGLPSPLHANNLLVDFCSSKIVFY